MRTATIIAGALAAAGAGLVLLWPRSAAAAGSKWAVTQLAAQQIGRGMRPEWLAAVMAFETGCTFSPSVKNPVSRATGLIQFMPATAKAMGTTVDALAAMTFAGQMEWVIKYFRQSPVSQYRNLGDVYMVVLWPAALGKPDDHKLFSSPSIQYQQNAGLDRDKKGYVTRADALRQVVAAGRRCPIQGQPATAIAGDAAQAIALLNTWEAQL